MSENRDVEYAILGLFFGIFSFFWGFNRFRRKRLIENIPTSTVRGMAMGLVELVGEAETPFPFKSPLTDTECVLYQYLIEEYRKSGKSGQWVKIASGDSFYSSFWLNDQTGRIMVFPKGAELILPVDYEFKPGLGKVLPENLIRFMEKSGISYKAWFGTRSLRFKEWYIRPRENVYVLGSAKKTEWADKEYKGKLYKRLDELKSSPQRMKEVDLDKNGEVSLEEWDFAVNKLESELLEETLKSTRTDNPGDVAIGKGEVEKIFMISDHSEKDLIDSLSADCILGIFGGAALSLVLLAYLLIRFNLYFRGQKTAPF